MKKMINKASGLMAIIAIASSCSTEDPVISRDIEINNDQVALSKRMTDLNEDVPITSFIINGKVKSLKLTLKAQLEPPTVDGQLLQATSISEDEGSFVVSYNFAGDTYYGGIDLIDKNIKLKSEIQFKDADVNDITILGDDVFFVGGTSSLETPAFVEKLSIKKNVFSLDDNRRSSVGSYTANSITNSGSDIYVTSGNDKSTGGGLYQFDKNMSQMNFYGIEDARWAVEANGVVYALSGNPSQVISFNPSLKSKNSFEHKALSNFESKMTVDVDDDLIFIAGGQEGLLVYDFDGILVNQYKFDDNSNTNAVTADDGTVFISNGEAGVYVASYEKDEITVIGKLELGSNESVNHILYENKKLYVASGLGGVKMIQIK